MFSERTLRRGAVLLLLLAAPLLWGNPFLGAPEKETPQVARTGPALPGLTERQLAVRSRMADLLLSIRAGDSPRLVGLLWAMAFFYGVLHASGPGHRKTVVFSLYLSRRARWFEPLGLGLLLSALHAGAAVLLILLYRSAAGPLLSRSINATTMQMEGWAYTILLLLSLLLLAGSLRHAFKGHHSHQGKDRSLLAVALTGFFPCPGAVMLLIFTLTQKMLPLGILTVGIMSLGMALPISAAGYLAYCGKKGLFSVLKKKEHLLHWASVLMEAGGYAFLLFFSFLMAKPFLTVLLGSG